MILDIPNEHLTAFVTCLALGTLREIRNGTISPDVGIWSLAVPRSVDPLEERGGVSPALIDALRECDELSTLHTYAPDAYNEAMTSLIDRLEAMLREVDDPCYRVEWHVPAPGFNPATAMELRARIVAIADRRSWVPSGRSRSVGAFEVEVLDSGEPPPRMLLFVSCPAELARRGPKFAVGATIEATLYRHKQRWPAVPGLPEGLARRYVASYRRSDPAVPSAGVVAGADVAAGEVTGASRRRGRRGQASRRR